MPTKTAYDRGYVAGLETGMANERKVWEELPLRNVRDLTEKLRQAEADVAAYQRSLNAASARNKELLADLGGARAEVTALRTSLSACENMLEANRKEVSRLNEALKAKTDPRAEIPNSEFKHLWLDAAKETNRLLTQIAKRI